MKATTRFGALAALLLLLPIAATAQEPEVETFDDVPAGWEFGPGTEVTDGVLLVHRGGPVMGGETFGDLEFSVSVRIDDTSVGAVMYRSSEHGSYVIFIAPNWVELFREGPQGVELAAGEAPVAPGTWVDVVVNVTGSDHTINVGGIEIQVTDPNPLPAGRITLRAEGEGAVAFDNLAIATEATPASSSAETGLSWVRTGGPLGGLGYDVRMDPRDPDHMYVTDAFAGVFISNDGGETWQPSSEGITTRVGASGDGIPVFTLSIDPNDPDTLWVGTQNTRGIFRSTDGGATWVQRDNGVVEDEGITVRGFGIEPGNSDTVYAAAELSSWAAGGEPVMGNEFDKTSGVVYKTTDGGDNWTSVWRGDNLARYVLIDPNDTNIVYVSTGIFDREAANSDHINRLPGGVGVLRSADAGRTWEQVNKGLENLYIGSLALHPDDPTILIAGAGNNTYNDGIGVYITGDGGTTWRRANSQGATAVEFAPSNPDIIYAADIQSFRRSLDAGLTWETVSGPDWGPPGVLAGFPIDLQVHPEIADRVFANNYGGGNFMSDDGGYTWKIASTGYTGAQVRDVVVDPVAPGRVYVAARSGLFTSADGGGHWQGQLSDSPAMLEWTALAMDPSNRQHMVAGTNWDGALTETFDAGTTWNLVLPTPGEWIGWWCLEYAPSNPQIVYGGTGAFHSASTFALDLPARGIWVSTDGGSVWEPANDSLSSDAQVAGIAVHPTDPMTVFAATTTDGLLRTSTGGASWEAVLNLPNNVPASSIVFDPSDPQHLLAGFRGAGIYESGDGGNNWSRQPVGFAPEAAITDIIFDPNDTSTVYAADLFSGVYRSQDGGQTWLTINEGLRTRSTNALALGFDGDHLYAGTEGEGVFRLDLSGAPPQEVAATEDAGDEESESDAQPPTASTTTTTSAPGSTTAEAAPPANEGSDSGDSAFPIIALVVAALAVGGGVGWGLSRKSR